MKMPMKFNEKQEEIYDKLVKSGASELFAGYVLKYPDSAVVYSFLAGHNGGHFYTALFEGNIIKAMWRADLENMRKLKKLLFESDNDFRTTFCSIPAYLKPDND